MIIMTGGGFMGDLYYLKEARKMFSVLDVANAFLAIDSMTPKKLQKLCYYAQAWNLAIDDEPLFYEDIEAWVHGPVVKKLYDEYRDYKWDAIPLYTEKVPDGLLTYANSIYDLYGEFNGDQLENLTHTESPWKNARTGLKPWEASNEKVTHQDMKDFFRTLLNN